MGDSPSEPVFERVPAALLVGHHRPRSAVVGRRGGRWLAALDERNRQSGVEWCDATRSNATHGGPVDRARGATRLCVRVGRGGVVRRRAAV